MSLKSLWTTRILHSRSECEDNIEYIYILLDVLTCSISVNYGRIKIQTTSENIQQGASVERVCGIRDQKVGIRDQKDQGLEGWDIWDDKLRDQGSQAMGSDQ